MTSTRTIMAVLVLGSMLGLAACSVEDPDLRTVRSTGEGPEEFGIVPNRPLELPPSFASLPPPTPEGANRTAQQPINDAIAALGGSPARAQPTGSVPAADGTLVASASRFGRDPTIRTTLAAEDLEFRQGKAIFSWQLVPSDRYNRAYEEQRLDPFVEIERFRRAGVQTPSAPPRDALR